MKNNYTVSVDYFIVKFTSDSNVIFGEELYQLEKDLELSISRNKKHSSAEFDYCYKILFKEKYIGKFYAIPSKRKFEKNPRTCEIRFDNSIFYDKSFKDVLEQLKSSEILQLKQKNCSRLDFSYDSTVDIRKKLQLIFRSIDDGEEKFKVANSLFTSASSNGKEKSYQFGSDKFIVVYNKSKELKKSSNKNYISKFHLLHRLTKDVIRTEFRLLNRNKKNKIYLDNIDVWQLHSTNYLLSIIKRINRDYFYFNKLEDKNISRCPKEYILELPDSTIPIEILKKGETRNINITKLKEYLNFLLKHNWCFPHAGSRQQLDWVKKKAKKEGLDDWLDKNMYGSSTFPFSLDEEEFYEKYKL